MTSAELARLDIELACFNKADAVFPILAGQPDIETDDDVGAEFRLDPSGSFVWNVTLKGKGRPLPDRLFCAGNSNERRIELIELNGVKKRPDPQEVWKF